MCKAILSADTSAGLMDPVLIPCGLEDGHQGAHRAENTPTFGFYMVVVWEGDKPRTFELEHRY